MTTLCHSVHNYVVAVFGKFWSHGYALGRLRILIKQNVLELWDLRENEHKFRQQGDFCQSTSTQ